MSVKSYVSIEVEKNGNVFTFSIPVGVSYGEVYDAAYMVLKKTVDLAAELAEANKPKEQIDQTVQTILN